MRKYAPYLVLSVAAFAAIQWACAHVDLLAPPGSSMTLVVNPPFVQAHTGVAIVTAIVTEPAGTPVPDGTVIQFFTNLGSIDREGLTNSGVARVNYRAGSLSGLASILAVSGGQAVAPTAPSTSPSGGGTTPPSSSGSNSASATVIVGNLNAARIFLRSEPVRITESRSTHVFALVFDAAGNPAAGVPVLFSVEADKSTEFFDSASRPIFTDNNGQAEDVLRTRRVRGASPGLAQVKASVPGVGAFVEATLEIYVE